MSKLDPFTEKLWRSHGYSDGKRESEIFLEYLLDKKSPEIRDAYRKGYEEGKAEALKNKERK